MNARDHRRYATRITAGLYFVVPGAAMLVAALVVFLSAPTPESPPGMIAVTPAMLNAAVLGGVLGGIGGVLVVTGAQLLYFAADGLCIDPLGGEPR